MRVGWYREVRAKSEEGQATRSLLRARSRLVMVRRDLQNQMRSMLAEIGQRLSRAVGRAFTRRLRERLLDHPDLSQAVVPLLSVYEHVLAEQAGIDKKLRMIARGDETVRRLMTVPGIGVVTALAYRHSIDDPARFSSAQTVGAYLGLTPRRHQSGKTDLQGGVPKQGDRALRVYLYEAATVLMHRTKRWSRLQGLGRATHPPCRLEEGPHGRGSKAAVILHCIWTDGTVFEWGEDPAAAAA